MQVISVSTILMVVVSGVGSAWDKGQLKADKADEETRVAAFINWRRFQGSDTAIFASPANKRGQILAYVKLSLLFH